MFPLLSAIYFLNVLTRMLFPMVAPSLAEKYVFTAATTGTLCLVLATGFGISLFLSQFATAHTSYQNVISFSSLSSGILLLFFPWVTNISLLMTYLFLFGLFSGLFMPAAIAYLTSLVNEAKIGKTIALFSLFQIFAMIAAPLVRVQVKHIEFCLFFAGIIYSIIGLLFATLTKKHTEKGVLPSFAYFRQAIFSRPLQTLLAIQSLAVGLNIGIFSIAPSYFLSDETLFWVLGGSRMLGIAGVLLSGWAIDAWGMRASLTPCLLLNGLFMLALGTIPSSFIPYLLALQGPLAISLTVMAHIGVSKIVSPHRKASLISIFSSISFILGAGILPQAMGLLQDREFKVIGFFLLAAITLLMGFICYKNDLFKQEAMS